MNHTKPSRKKAFITQAVGGYILTVIAIVKGLFLLPLYFKFISYGDYGYWVTISSIVALLSIINFGIGTMATQRISQAYARKDFQAVGDYFINSVVIYVVISIAFLCFGFVLSFWLENILKIPIEELKVFKIAFYIALSTTSLSFFSNSFRGFAGSLLKPLFGIYVMIASNLFGIFLVIVLLYNDVGILSLPISLLATESIIMILCGFYIFVLYKKFHIKSQIKLGVLQEYLKFTPHLFGLVVGNRLVENIHPIIITTFLGSELTTAYDITRKVIDITLRALNVLNASLLAPFSHLVGEGNKELIQKNTKKIILYSFLIGIVGYGVYISSNIMFIHFWIDNDIALNQSIVTFIGLSAFVFSMNRLLRSLLLGFDEIKFVSNTVLLEGIFYTMFSVILIGRLGIIAIPVSFLVVSIFFNIYIGKRLLEKVDIQINRTYLIRLCMMIGLISISLYVMNTLFVGKSWFSFIFNVLLTSLVLIVLEVLFNYRYIKSHL
ncbi:lipopolysaccharide biosynthesis protein [Sulfurimonas indica]|uniref:lipopolysaccharide biosynthesis protein n=1 Tax=Sulfurimonas indica TaxID=2508707 RepID=UPI0012644636|nr:MATE family efflux transporter [Sulfurimonas indica]